MATRTIKTSVPWDTGGTLTSEKPQQTAISRKNGLKKTGANFLYNLGSNVC